MTKRNRPLVYTLNTALDAIYLEPDMSNAKAVRSKIGKRVERQLDGSTKKVWIADIQIDSKPPGLYYSEPGKLTDVIIQAGSWLVIKHSPVTTRPDEYFQWSRRWFAHHFRIAQEGDEVTPQYILDDLSAKAVCDDHAEG